MSPDEESAELTFMSEQVLEARRLLQQALRSLDRAVPAEAAIENALLMSDRQGQLEPADLNVQELLERCAELEAWNARLLAEVEGYQELLAFREKDRPTGSR